MIDLTLLVLKNISIIAIIIFEIAITVFAVIKLRELEQKVDKAHEKMLIISTEVLILNDKIKEIMIKINKVLKFITNKRFYQVISILKTAFNTVQIILLIRSFDFSNGKLFNYKNIKKLFVSEIIRRFIRKILLNTANLV